MVTGYWICDQTLISFLRLLGSLKMEDDWRYDTMRLHSCHRLRCLRHGHHPLHIVNVGGHGDPIASVRSNIGDNFRAEWSKNLDTLIALGRPVLHILDFMGNNDSWHFY